ncbi:PilZ domain-containing protein [Bosea lathyri]|jgi:hypothetical protein|uniref:PilZ domain-containing protein n=1 Tax=Bosea lathyri TaxID=1036778 RepID=A0A1H5TZ27_9HYPH|nr:PilZ domain-containing protein [Bosea lathyri]SEF67438.1 PilZ domain-containing protein [Bosea lathyri]
MTIERRKTPRLRSLLGGRVSFNQQRSTLDCLVRNISDDGALLLISDSIALPIAFDLTIPQRQRSYPARLRWRDGERIGIVFEIGGGAVEIVPLDLARRLKLAEQNNAQLKTRIRQLTEAG